MINKAKAAVVDLLNNLQCLRLFHVQEYLRGAFSGDSWLIDKTLNQLKTAGYIAIQNGLIMLPGRKPNENILRAADVMITLTKGRFIRVIRGDKLFTLIYAIHSKTGGEAYFGIIMTKLWSEEHICRELQTIDESITIIFVLETMEQQIRIHIKNNHYFALSDEHDNYKFYKTAAAVNLN